MLQSGRQKYGCRNRSVLDGLEWGRVGAERDSKVGFGVPTGLFSILLLVVVVLLYVCVKIH